MKNEDIKKIKNIINLIINIKGIPGDFNHSLYFPQKEFRNLGLNYISVRNYIKKYPEIFNMYGIHAGDIFITYNGNKIWS